MSTKKQLLYFSFDLLPHAMEERKKGEEFSKKCTLALSTLLSPTSRRSSMILLCQVAMNKPWKFIKTIVGNKRILYTFQHNEK
jgi:hypothetical protein